MTVVSAPWVDLCHSKNTTMQAARLIPTGAFGVLNLLPKAQPVFASSGKFFTGISNAISGSDSQEERRSEDSKRLEVEYGIPRKVQDQSNDLIFKSMLSENTVGANSEALLCLNKGPGVTWGACQDYDVFLKRLYETERERLASAGMERTRAKLRIRAYLAESDALIGKTGNVYLTNLFRSETGGLGPDVVDFEASTIAGTDHDTLFEKLDVLEEIFVQAGGHSTGSTA